MTAVGGNSVARGPIGCLGGIFTLCGVMILSACGGGGGGGGTPPPPPPAAPSGLTYSGSNTLVVGAAASLNPSVNGTVSSYAVSPALPAGLMLNTTTGMISGTPTTVTNQATYTVTASNSGGSTNFALKLTINPAAPSALSYTTPPPLLVGNTVSLSPSVTGVVTSYSASPALPAGLLLSAMSGAISGTPTTVTAKATYTISASNVTGTKTFALNLTVDPGPTVHLTATASDAQSNPLTYRWKTTDGVLLNVNANQADWMLPAGKGLHFAYVLVNNGHGGYKEGRISVSTDTIGNPAVTPPSVNIVAPTSALQDAAAYSFRGFGGTGLVSGARAPGLYFQVQDAVYKTIYPAAGSAPIRSDLRGQFVVPGISSLFALQFNILCSFDGASYSPCSTSAETEPLFSNYFSDYEFLSWPVSTSYLVGGAFLSDGATPCGLLNPFFGIATTGSAILSDTSGNVLFGPMPLDVYGQFALNLLANAASVTVNCESAAPLIYQLNTAVLIYPTLGDKRFPTAQLFAATLMPQIASMTATYNGTSVGTFPVPPPTGGPPPGGLKSDLFPESFRFLAYKGLDTAKGACQYYKAIGAVTDCNVTTGAFVGPVMSFSDWKRNAKIDVAGSNPPTYTATFINQMDLNLTRAHHAISYGPGNTSAYVCNHLGPPLDPSDPTQLTYTTADVDTAIQAAANGANEVACVVMDFVVNGTANGGQPFTRFLIFGPNGQLLPSVNLDGRGEKYVPSACVSCHGGDHYAGAYPEDGSGTADIGGHFLPFDTGNFLFSPDLHPYTKDDQQQAIFNLNQLVINSGGATAATKTLVAGWYPNNSPPLLETYVSPSWVTAGATPTAFYQNVYARSCRTCHTAQPAYLDFDQYVNINPIGANYLGLYQTGLNGLANTLCNNNLNGPGFGLQGQRVGESYSMPNSLVAFNRFWNSKGSTAVPDQPTLVEQFFSYLSNGGVRPSVYCDLN